MQVTKQDIQEYRTQCQSKLGVEVDAAQAHLELSELVLLVEMLYRPMTYEEFSNVRRRQLQLMTMNNGELNE